MGDVADDYIEQGQEIWWDHLAGHPEYPDECPYCENDKGDK